MSDDEEYETLKRSVTMLVEGFDPHMTCAIFLGLMLDMAGKMEPLDVEMMCIEITKANGAIAMGIDYDDVCTCGDDDDEDDAEQDEA